MGASTDRGDKDSSIKKVGAFGKATRTLFSRNTNNKNLLTGGKSEGVVQKPLANQNKAVKQNPISQRPKVSNLASKIEKGLTISQSHQTVGSKNQNQIKNKAFNYDNNEYGAQSSRVRAPMKRNDSAGLFNNNQAANKQRASRNSISESYTTFDKEYQP